MSKRFLNFFIILIVLAACFLLSDGIYNASNENTEEVQSEKKIIKVYEKIESEKIKRGETLSSILRKHQIEQSKIFDIIQSFKDIYPVRRMKIGDEYRIGKDSANVFSSFTYLPNLQETYKVFENAAGQLDSKVEKIKLIKKEKSITGSIQSSLYDAILKNGETPELLFLFTDIFQWDIDFFIDPRLGDQFKIIYEKYYLPHTGQFVKYGNILSAQYVLNKKDTLTALYFDNSPAKPGYYDLNGNSFQKTFLKSPLNYRRISSYFSYSRRHPILKIRRPHYGVDYAAPSGTPVSAAADGIVIDRGCNRSIGNFIKIRHKNARFVTLYGHLSRFQKGIYKGVRVKQKDVIGYVGKTGLATGPHLHYAFYDNGRPIDPLKIKNTSGDPVLPENRLRFNETKHLASTQLIKIDDIHLPLIWLTANHVHYNRYAVPAR